MYLLGAGSRDGGTQRGGGQTAWYRGESRQVSVSCDRQGGGDWRDRGLCENRRDQAIRRSDRMPDNWTRRHRYHFGGGARQGDRDDGHGNRQDRASASDDVGGDHAGGFGG